VKVTTDAGAVTLTGLEVRFALAIPESLFTVTAGKDEKGPVLTFYGRGWGHGVGLCQNGAFGQALAGRTYREILSHYYPGTTVEQALTLRAALRSRIP
jgi:stage II sporulation protein D